MNSADHTSTSLSTIRALLLKYVNDEADLLIKESEYSSFKVIDLKEGTKLLGGHREAAENMLSMFIETLPQELKKIMAAHEEKNFLELYKLIHKLYGGLCYCGAPKMRAITKQIYILLEHRSHQSIASLLKILILAAYELVEAHIKKQIAK